MEAHIQQHSGHDDKPVRPGRGMTLQPETRELHEALECCDLPDVPANVRSRLRPSIETHSTAEVPQ